MLERMAVGAPMPARVRTKHAVGLRVGGLLLLPQHVEPERFARTPGLQLTRFVQDDVVDSQFGIGIDQGRRYLLQELLQELRTVIPGVQVLFAFLLTLPIAYITLGLIWFAQNDPALPEDFRRRASEWGLSRDEYEDNGNFPRQVYVREGRRIQGEHLFTAHLTENDPVRPHPERIAYQIPGAHFPLTFDIWRPGFEAHHMAVAQL